MNTNFFAVILFVGIFVNGIWYYIKYIVHQNGYETHFFWGHWQDILHLHQLIAREQDSNKKSQLKTLLFSFYAILLILLGSFFLYFLMSWF